MNINNKLTLGTPSQIANIAAGGNIGTAATTVDYGSSFHINQTTAGQTLTLPNPTTSEVGQVVVVLNVGTASFTMHGVTVEATTGASFQWSGTAWIPYADVFTSTPAKKYTTTVNLTALTAQTITHNLALATASGYVATFIDANGNAVDLRTSALTVNSFAITSNVAVTNLTVTVVG